jgi:hypothetical protein
VSARPPLRGEEIDLAERVVFVDGRGVGLLRRSRRSPSLRVAPLQDPRRRSPLRLRPCRDLRDQPLLGEHSRKELLHGLLVADRHDGRERLIARGRELRLGRVPLLVRPPAAARVAVAPVPPRQRRELVAARLALHGRHDTPAPFASAAPRPAPPDDSTHVSARCETERVDVRPVDPRDTTWEVDGPAYRVYFWKPVPQPIGLHKGFESEEFEVTGADVQEVIAWAEVTVGSDRTYSLYVLVRCLEGELGLVRLAATDPLRRCDPLG